MPVADLLGEMVSIQFNPDVETGDMGGSLDTWNTIGAGVRCSIREMDPKDSYLYAAAGRLGNTRAFHVRFLGCWDLDSRNRLVWDDANTGRVRYLHIEHPPRYRPRTDQCLAVAVEVAT